MSAKLHGVLKLNQFIAFAVCFVSLVNVENKQNIQTYLLNRTFPDFSLKLAYSTNTSNLADDVS